MKTANVGIEFVTTAILSAVAFACSGTDSAQLQLGGSGSDAGGASSSATTSEALGGGNGSGGISASGGATSATGGLSPDTTILSGGSPATGGVKATGGAGVPGGAKGTGGAKASGGIKATGGERAAVGGAESGSGGAALGGGTSVSTATGGSTTGSGTACAIGTWPAADPAIAGPFSIVTEENVGPQAGEGVDGGAPPQFTMFRPKDMAQGGLCHPIVTWGNGTGATPSMYKVLLGHLASHGFVVIASNSTNVGRGSPAPMVVGVTWVIEQSADPNSVLYQRIDATRVGATGHSQGGFATTSAGADSRITTIAPLCGASTQRNLHGPAFLFCGGGDTTVPCSTIQTAFNGITNQPVMLANNLAADHANWLTFLGTKPSVVEATVTAWMRVHLMGDTALRARFYGATCALCQDASWQVTQKMMDQ